MIELPPYRLPGLRTALLHTFDRAKIFVKQAGTIILAISLVLWALSHYPKSSPPATAVAMQTQASQLEKSGEQAKADELRANADRLTAQYSLQNSLCRENRPRHRAGHPAAWLRLADWHRHRQLVRGARGHRLHARHCLRRGRGRRRQQPKITLRHAASGEAHGRLAGVHRRDVPEPARILHPGRAMPVHPGRRPARDEQLEVAAISNRLHERPGLRRRAGGVSNDAALWLCVNWLGNKICFHQTRLAVI